MSPEALYDKYHRLVHYVAIRMRRSYKLSEEDQEDIAGAVFVKLIAIPMEKIDGRGADGYVRTVINNEARNELRRIRKGLEVRLYEDYGLCDEGSNESSQIEFEDTSQDTELAFIDKQTLDQYLSTLNKYERKIVDMMLGSAEREPMTFRQIAKEQKKTFQAIRQTFVRSVERFRTQNMLEK